MPLQETQHDSCGDETLHWREQRHTQTDTLNHTHRDAYAERSTEKTRKKTTQKRRTQTEGATQTQRERHSQREQHTCLSPDRLRTDSGQSEDSHKTETSRMGVHVAQEILATRTVRQRPFNPKDRVRVTKQINKNTSIWSVCNTTSHATSIHCSGCCKYCSAMCTQIHPCVQTERRSMQQVSDALLISISKNGRIHPMAMTKNRTTKWPPVFDKDTLRDTCKKHQVPT